MTEDAKTAMSTARETRVSLSHPKTNERLRSAIERSERLPLLNISAFASAVAFILALMSVSVHAAAADAKLSDHDQAAAIAATLSANDVRDVIPAYYRVSLPPGIKLEFRETSAGRMPAADPTPTTTVSVPTEHR